MSFGAEKITIKLETEEGLKGILGFRPEDGSYELVDGQGDVYTPSDAAGVLELLRKAEPEKTFLAARPED